MKRVFDKSFINILLVLILIVFFVSFAGFAASKPEVVVDEWEIPFLNCLTGPIASIGEYMAWSAHRAADEINAAGGISGKPVKIIDCDTGVSAEKAIEEMAKIVDTALVELGPVPEACIMAAVPLAVEKGLFCMTFSTSYEYAVKYFPWTISYCPPNVEKVAPVAALWARTESEMKTVVQFVEKWASWPGIAEYQAVGLESEGVKMLEDVEVPTDAVIFGPLVVRALAQKPDGFLLTCNSKKAADIIIELDKHGWKDKSKILVFVSADDTPLYTTGGEYLNDCYVYNYINPDCDNPRWISFREAYKADHSGLEPSSLSTLYYDCVYMIKEAIENTGATGDPKKLAEERIKIRDYCRNVKGFEGIQTTWDFEDGKPAGIAVYLFKIQDGKKVFVDSTK